MTKHLTFEKQFKGAYYAVNERIALAVFYINVELSEEDISFAHQTGICQVTDNVIEEVSGEILFFDENGMFITVMYWETLLSIPMQYSKDLYSMAMEHINGELMKEYV